MIIEERFERIWKETIQFKVLSGNIRGEIEENLEKVSP
jgi:hypothetical protein